MNPTARASAAPGYEIGAPPSAGGPHLDGRADVGSRRHHRCDQSGSLAGDSAAVESWGRFLRLSRKPGNGCSRHARSSSSSTFRRSADDRSPYPRRPPPRQSDRHRGAGTIRRGPHRRRDLRRGAGRRLRAGSRRHPMPSSTRSRSSTGSRPAHATDRVLATVLFTDIVDSTHVRSSWATRGGGSCSKA